MNNCSALLNSSLYFFSDYQLAAYFVTYFLRPDFLIAFGELENGKYKQKKKSGGTSVSILSVSILPILSGR